MNEVRTTEKLWDKLCRMMSKRHVKRQVNGAGWPIFFPVGIEGQHVRFSIQSKGTIIPFYMSPTGAQEMARDLLDAAEEILSLDAKEEPLN